MPSKELVTLTASIICSTISIASIYDVVEYSLVAIAVAKSAFKLLTISATIILGSLDELSFAS